MNVVERFLGYTKINTTTNQANGAAGIMPSSAGQYELACLVKKQLEELGCVDIVLRDTAILTATLPSNTLIPAQSELKIRMQKWFIMKGEIFHCLPVQFFL